MTIYKCKMCGGNIEVVSGGTIGVCDSCGTKQTLPKTNDDIIANLFNRANNLRLKCEFDKAAQVYEKIVDQDDSEAEAHWGMVLCKYGIEYVEDPKTFECTPTCHRTLFDAITVDLDYLATIDYSDASQQIIYESEARAIARIQKDILAIAKNEKPFDVFICYKEADEYGKRTVDSTIGNDIYYQLTREGFNVFFAGITLEEKLGQEYEPYIFAALNSSRVMLVLGTKPEYYTAVWVKNEWHRFMQLIKADRSKLLIPCYRDMDAYDLPKEFAHLQALDMSKIGFISDLVRGIRKILVQEKQVETLKSDTNYAIAADSVVPLLKRIKMFLEDGEFSNADEFCENILNIDPENSDAYIYKLMVQNKIYTEKGFDTIGRKIVDDKNFKKAYRFATETRKKELDEISKSAVQYELESVYQKTCEELSAAQSLNQFAEVYKKFEKIKEYPDACEKMKTIEEQVYAPTYSKAILSYEDASTYKKMSNLNEVFVLLDDYSDAHEYVEKIRELLGEWRLQLEQIVENGNNYHTAAEIVNDVIEMPSMIDNEQHFDFLKKLDNLILIEKYYGNRKEKTLELLHEYSQQCKVYHK